MVGDRLLGAEQPLRGRGGAAVAHGGVLAAHRGREALRVRLVGVRTGAACAAVSVSTSAIPAADVAAATASWSAEPAGRPETTTSTSPRPSSAGSAAGSASGAAAIGSPARGERVDERGGCFGISVDDERAQVGFPAGRGEVGRRYLT